MGQKTNPVGFRLAVRRNWQSRWYAGKKDFSKLLVEDQLIRSKLMEKLKQASVPRIFIERASNRVRVKIYTARPGVVIGRKGAEIDKLKEELSKMTGKEVYVDIIEVKSPESDAQLVEDRRYTSAASMSSLLHELLQTKFCIFYVEVMSLLGRLNHASQVLMRFLMHYSSAVSAAFLRQRWN